MAEPMSMIFALPVRLTMMFDGLMSPCTISSRCSAASAGQALADDRHGHARLEPNPPLPGGGDHVVDVVPAAVAARAPRARSSISGASSESRS